MASDWKLLRLSSDNPRIPPLLVKYEFGRSNYKIWVTDLAHVWTEVLDQRPLIQRAWDLEADIDPIESDQRQMLLQRIQDSLNEAKGTKLAFSTSDQREGIVLTTYSPLPKPLKPLQWPFHLTLHHGIALTNELILPLLSDQLLFRKKIASLLVALQDKDHVIGKLTDKMQAEGVELGKVFPAAMSSKSSRKAVSKDDVGKSVQGLGSFDKAQWQSRFAEDPGVPKTCSSLLSQLFSQGVTLSLSKFDGQHNNDAWWEHLSTGSNQLDDESEGTLQTQSPSPTAEGFQRQSTPDHLEGPPPKGHPPSMEMILPERGSNSNPSFRGRVDDGSTTETSDENLDSVQLKSRASQQNPKVESKQSSPSNTSSPEPTSITGPKQPPKPTGALGRIGGSSKPSASPSKPKLGKIGGTGAIGKPLKTVSKSPEPRGRSPIPRKSPSPQRETSQERADKKREQLKRELEEKSRLGAKKKRKF